MRRDSVTSPALRYAAYVMRSGGIIGYATEYCFGLGCDPRNPDAVARLLRLKHRPARKGLIIIAADTKQLSSYVEEISDTVSASWPGPHTWLLTPKAGVPRWVTGKHPRLAVRVTAHGQAAALCRVFGAPIISTSANRAGTTPVRSYREMQRRFGTTVDYILPGNVGDLAAPTQIRDAVTGKLVRG